jgi:hypothetical protein
MDVDCTDARCGIGASDDMSWTGVGGALTSGVLTPGPLATMLRCAVVC